MKLMKRLASAWLFLCLGCTSVFSSEWEGKRSSFHGFDQYDFALEELDCKVVVPEEVAEGTPWVWRARFFGHEPQVDVALLKKGFHVAYVDVSDLFGSPKAVARWDAFYDYLTTEKGFSRKPALEGMSRGGLIIYNWASKNPEKVSCIYADAPVCDIKRWPGDEGEGSGAPRAWKKCLEAYGLSEAEALAYDKNPVDNLAPLAAAGVPLLHVVGDADKVVRVEENTAVVEARYKKLGGSIEVIHKPGVGHHPHSLKDPKPIVDFILKHAVSAGGAALPVREGLFLDLDANAGVELEDGKRVKSWRNQVSGNAAEVFVKQDEGRKQAGSGRPTLKSKVAEIGGHDTLVFEEQELVNMDEDAFDPMVTGRGYTWFSVMCVYKQRVGKKDVNSFFGNLRNGPPYDGFWGNLMDDNRVWMGTRNGIASKGKPGLWDEELNPCVASKEPIDENRYYLIMGRMGAGQELVDLELFINSATPVDRKPVPVNPKANPSKMAIGQERDATNHPGKESFHGEIARFLVYERPLSDEELSSMIRHLVEAYGIKVGDS